MKNKFNFYEVVKVITNLDKLKEINGSLGVILGMSQNELTDEWIYGVSIDKDEGLVWSIKEKYLQSTGEKRSREDFYSGETIRVQVDPKTGEGNIVEEE